MKLQSQIVSYVFLEFRSQLGNVRLALLLPAVHLRLECLTSGIDKRCVEFLPLARRLLDFAEFGSEHCHFIGLHGQSTLLGSLELLRDGEVLRGARLGRRGCPLGHRWLSQDHLVAQAALLLLLASDLGGCNTQTMSIFS